MTVKFTAAQVFNVGGKIVHVGMIETDDDTTEFVYAAARSDENLQKGFCYYGASPGAAIALMLNELRGSDFFDAKPAHDMVHG